jgi:hypothetical protein
MILVFKSKERYNNLFYLFVYVKIIDKTIHIKSDMTMGVYLELEQLILTHRLEKMQQLAEMKVKINEMTKEEFKKYVIEEFDKMNYNVYGCFDDESSKGKV